MTMLQVTATEQKMYDFDLRCAQLGGYLQQGKSVTMSEAQLKWYSVTPHQVIAELLNWVNSAEAEEVWDEANAGAYHQHSRSLRTYVIYCTKVQDKYKFKAVVKA